MLFADAITGWLASWTNVLLNPDAPIDPAAARLGQEWLRRAREDLELRHVGLRGDE